MHKLLLILACFITSAAFARQTPLFTVEMIKAKAGHMAAFEAAWQSHVARFHGKDSKTRYVHSILSGPYLGYYQLMEGPSPFAAMDASNPQKKEHDLDYDEQVLPNIEVRKGNLIYTQPDSLSWRADLHPEKILTTLFYLKQGMEKDFIAEMGRTAQIDRKINSHASYRCYVLQLGGSLQQVMLITNLPEGFSQLEAGYFPALSEAFKKAYIARYSQQQWNRRNKLLQDAVESYETYIAKLNKPLSSPLK